MKQMRNRVSTVLRDRCLIGCSLLVMFAAVPGIAQVPGTIVASGENGSGQLGNGSNQDSSVPVQVLNLTDVAAIATGNGHGLALMKSGTVYAWGKNDRGQLGNECTVNSSCYDSNVPVPVTRYSQPLSDVIAVAAGDKHSMALTSWGYVLAWGDNSSGQLGDFSTTPRGRPQYVKHFWTILQGVRAIAAGGSHSLAALANGSLVAWGNNKFGQLGDGTWIQKSVPFPVQGVSAITGIAAGGWHSLARDADGNVFAWGRNKRGQLGNGSFGDKNTPVPVSLGPSPQKLVSVAAGREHSMALKSDGTAWSWGRNVQGQLGRTTAPNNEPNPGQIPLADVARISAGANHSLATQTDGTVWAWGSNAQGQFGMPTLFPWIHRAPLEIQGLEGVTTVAAGAGYSLFSKVPWTMWTWGPGGIGDGTFHSRETPGPVDGPTWVVSMAAGNQFNLAVAPTGRVWAWGFNTKGQLGDGGSTFDGNPASPFPVQVRLGKGFLGNALAVAAGPFHSLALTTQGTQTLVYAWGSNFFGQLGDNTTVDRNLPVLVEISSAVALGAGAEYSLAQTRDGSLWGWGSNYFGQMGNGSPPAVYTTPQQTNMKEVIDFAGGDAHVLAVKDDGTVWAWGYNNHGQLGDGCDLSAICPSAFEPAPVLGVSDVVQVAAGATGSMALESDGSVWTWGWNDAGQLGDGCQVFVNCLDSSVPVRVNGLPPIVSIGSSGYGRMAAGKDGTLWVWGDGNSTPQKLLHVDGMKFPAAGSNTQKLIAFPNP